MFAIKFMIENLNSELYNFTNAAPMLESLSVSIKIGPLDCVTELKHIVFDHHWTNLRRVHFDIFATQADFAIFSSRHAPTLRHFSLENVKLPHQGSWISTLEGTQKSLSLDTAKMRGFLACFNPPQRWSHHTSCYQNRFSSQGERNRDALSKYLVYGGTCSFLDEEKHPNEAGT